MNPWLNLLPEVEDLTRLGIVLLVQTSLLLGVGLWARHVLQKRKSGACTLLGRLLLLATLSLVVVSTMLTTNHRNRVPAVWNVGLPLPAQRTPIVADNALPVALPSSPSHSQAFPKAENAERTQPDEEHSTTLPVGGTSASLGSSPVEQTAPSKAPRSTLDSSFTSSQNGGGNVWVGLVALLWLSGALLQLLWLSVCHALLWRLRSGAAPVTDARILVSLKRVCATLEVRAPALLCHQRVASPFLTGLRRPAIVFPTDAHALPEAALEAVLFHEVSHLKRWDLWWNALGRVLCALLWPQPLLWMLCRRLEQINEEACDGAVLGAGCSPGEYAQVLIDWAQSRMPRRIERVAGAGVMTGRSSLSRRVHSILSEGQSNTQAVSKRVRRAMLLGAAGAVLALPLLVSGAPDGTSPQRAPSSAVPNAKKALQHFQQADEYGVYIGGVSDGVLQSLWIAQQMGAHANRLIMARTAIRQSGKVPTSQVGRWILNQGASYTFDRVHGLLSTMKFERLTLNTGSQLGSFLEEQSQAVSEPAGASEWKDVQRMAQIQSPVLMREIMNLQAWSKGKRATLSGRVVDEEGRPVARAKVQLQMNRGALLHIVKLPANDYPNLFNYAFVLPKPLRDVLAQSVTTDSNGTYRFVGLGPVPYNLDMEYYGRVKASHFDVALPARVLTQTHQVVARQNQTTPAPDLVVTRGGLVRVRVEDKTGESLPGIFVIAGASKNDSPSYQIETDASGESLFRLPEGKASISIGNEFIESAHVFVARSRGVAYSAHNGAEFSVDGGQKLPFQKRPFLGVGTAEVQIVRNQTHEVVLLLQRFVAPTPTPKPTPTPLPVPPPPGKATLLGRVVNEAGEGVGGIPVFARIQQSARWRLMQGAGLAYSNNSTPNFERKWASIQGVLSQSTKTRADGSFRFDGLTTAPYNIVIATDNESFGLRHPSGWVAPAVEGIWAKEGQVVRRASPIVLTRGALIEGLILDKATGLPLGGINIGSNGPQLPLSTDFVMSATSDAQGKFTLRVAPGTTSLYIAGPWNNNSAVYADDGQSADNVARIVTSRGLFAGSGNVPFEIDGGETQVGLNIKARGKGQIEIPLQSGQTRRLTLHLRRLKPRPKPQSKVQ